jgi:hypothetical protein
VKVLEPIEVSFSAPAYPPAGERLWITLAPAGSPDSEWGELRDVARGEVRKIILPPLAGDYEVRLHDGYPARPHHVVSRAKITVDGT